MNSNIFTNSNNSHINNFSNKSDFIINFYNEVCFAESNDGLEGYKISKNPEGVNALTKYDSNSF